MKEEKNASSNEVNKWINGSIRYLVNKILDQRRSEFMDMKQMDQSIQLFTFAMLLLQRILLKWNHKRTKEQPLN